MKHYKEFRMALEVINTIAVLIGVIAMIWIAYQMFLTIPVYD